LFFLSNLTPFRFSYKAKKRELGAVAQLSIAFRDLATVERAIESLASSATLAQGSYAQTGIHIMALATAEDFKFDVDNPDSFNVARQWEKAKERQRKAGDSNPVEAESSARATALSETKLAQANSSSADKKASSPVFLQHFELSSGKQFLLTTSYADRIQGPEPKRHIFPSHAMMRAMDEPAL